jgi:hypothetical protein
VRAGLAEWAEAEGAPFLYDGADYMVGLFFGGGRVAGRWRFGGALGRSRELEGQPSTCSCLLLAAWLPPVSCARVSTWPPLQAVLEGLEQQLKASAQEKAARTQARRLSGSGGGGGASGTPSSASRTPLPKGVAGGQLQERHSIAVVRCGAGLWASTRARPAAAPEQAVLRRRLVPRRCLSIAPRSPACCPAPPPSTPSPAGTDQAALMRASGQVTLLRATPPSGGGRLPPRTPPPSGAARVAAAAAAAMGAAGGGAGGPASERIANIFARPPLQPAAPALSPEPSSLRTPTPPPDASAAAARGAPGDQDGGRGRDVGAAAGGGGGEDAANDLAAMFDSLVARTTQGPGGAKVWHWGAASGWLRRVSPSPSDLQTLSPPPPPLQASPGGRGARAASPAPTPPSAAAAGAPKTPPSVGRGGSRIPQPQF